MVTWEETTIAARAMDGTWLCIRGERDAAGKHGWPLTETLFCDAIIPIVSTDGAAIGYRAQFGKYSRVFFGTPIEELARREQVGPSAEGEE